MTRVETETFERLSLVPLCNLIHLEQGILQICLHLFPVNTFRIELVYQQIKRGILETSSDDWVEGFALRFDNDYASPVAMADIDVYVVFAREGLQGIIEYDYRLGRLWVERSDPVCKSFEEGCGERDFAFRCAVSKGLHICFDRQFVVSFYDVWRSPLALVFVCCSIILVAGP